MDACAKAAPDGYTVCVPSFAQMSANPVLYNKLPYDPLRDLAPVIQFAAITSAITVNASVPANSLQELVALAEVEARRSELGLLGPWQLLAPLHGVAAERDRNRRSCMCPTKRLGQAVTGLVAGEVQVMVTTPSTAAPLAEAGQGARCWRSSAGSGHRCSTRRPCRQAGFELPLVSWVGVTVPGRDAKADRSEAQCGVRQAAARSGLCGALSRRPARSLRSAARRRTSRRFSRPTARP